MNNNETVADCLKKSRELVDVIASSLPDRIEIAGLPLNSKIPFKAVSLRELLFHRAAALAGLPSACTKLATWLAVSFSPVH